MYIVQVYKTGLVAVILIVTILLYMGGARYNVIERKAVLVLNIFILSQSQNNFVCLFHLCPPVTRKRRLPCILDEPA